MFKQMISAAREESADPEARAAAKQAAGGALIADGLVGLENPLNRRSRAGIFGTLFIMLFGLVFLGAGLMVRSSLVADAGDIVVEGRIVDVSTSRGDNGAMHAPIVEYADIESGQVYVTTGSVRSNSRPSIGDTRDVAYPPRDPSAGKVIGDVWFAWIFIGVGAGVVLVGLVTFVIRLGSIVLGTKMVLEARNERKALGSDAGVVTTLAQSASDVFAARRSHRLAVQPVAPEATIQPKLPPAGWYPDPEGVSTLRWFDGVAWTAHRSDAASAI